MLTLPHYKIRHFEQVCKQHKSGDSSYSASCLRPEKSPRNKKPFFTNSSSLLRKQSSSFGSIEIHPTFLVVLGKRRAGCAMADWITHIYILRGFRTCLRKCAEGSNFRCKMGSFTQFGKVEMANSWGSAVN